MKKINSAIIAACACIAPSLSFASCGASFCTANSNWTAESAAIEPGSTFDLRYEYIKQHQPRTGSDPIRVGQISRHHDEVRTINHNVLATFSHTFNSAWGISVTAPFVDRNHFHIHNHRGAQIPDTWEFREWGDVRVTGRYQLPYLGDPLKPVTAGIVFGLKLPTGQTGIANENGDQAERSLQPGSGTTDAVIGAYHHQKIPGSNAAWFIQTQYQHALNRHDNYKPGAQFGIDIGYRHGVTDRLGALIQLNYLLKRPDSGTEAEPQDSGGRFVALSPGLAYAVTDQLQLYALLQKPLYQHVNGVQLTADKAFVIGIGGRF